MTRRTTPLGDPIARRESTLAVAISAGQKAADARHAYERANTGGGVSPERIAELKAKAEATAATAAAANRADRDAMAAIRALNAGGHR